MKFPTGIFYEIQDKRIVKAIHNIPRELFVPNDLMDMAYINTALPIGFGQTISQPSLVAYMTQLLGLTGKERVLEVGTGSGYQTALLAKLAYKVYTVEIIKGLHERAKEVLDKLGFDNIQFKLGDGYMGWEIWAPYDRILVTAAPPYIPEGLMNQLKDGGRMVIPVGGEGQVQILKLIEKDGEETVERDMTYVRFVPMVGE